MEDKDIIKKNEIRKIFDESKSTYGYRRITIKMRQNGFLINHKKVYKLMKELSLKCKTSRKKKYNSYKGKLGRIADNLLNRNFNINKPMLRLVTDVSEFSIQGKKIYLSPILDLFNREIISYSISSSPNFHQIMEMLEKAFSNRALNQNIILHSDQGWQYQMKIYQSFLKKKGIIQSMSRKGNCLDNAVMENFFGLLKKEMYYGMRFSDISELREKIEEYIEFYNNDRVKANLKGLSPVEYRLQSQYNNHKN